jgi:hypothetical protein
MNSKFFNPFWASVNFLALLNFWAIWCEFFGVKSKSGANWLCPRPSGVDPNRLGIDFFEPRESLVWNFLREGLSTNFLFAGKIFTMKRRFLFIHAGEISKSGDDF